jgi:hypothetical protein
MAAIALSGAASNLIKSPWHAFVGLTPPALVSSKPPVLTLATDSASGWKTPDNTGSPNAFYLGCTKAGWTGSSSGGGVTETFCDELTSPVFVDTETGSYQYEADLFTVLNVTALTALYGMTDLANGSGGAQHLAGPASFTAPETSLMLLSRRLVSSVYKYSYIFFPSVKQTALYGQGSLTRTEVLSAKLTINVQAYSPWSNVPFVKYWEN